MHHFRRLVFAFSLVLLAFSGFFSPATADPVTGFIVEADAAFQTGGDSALHEFVAENPLLVGAAVAQMIDVAIALQADGDAGAAQENVDFAETVASHHATASGSSVPATLVLAYQNRSDADWAEFRRAKGLEAQASEARAAGDPALGAEHLKQALEIYAQIGASHDEAVAWGTLGVFEWARGDMQAVRAAYEKAIVARRAVEDRLLQGRTLNGLGSVAMQLGEYETAGDFYGQAKEMRRAIGDMGGLGTTLTYLGNVYYVLGQLVPARKHFEEALPILEAQGEMKRLSELYTSIGNLHSSMGRYDEAASSYARVIDIAQQIDAADDELIGRVNYADNLRLEGRYQEALGELELAEALAERVEEPTMAVILHRVRGLTFHNVGDFDRAREDLVAALKLAQERGLPDLQTEALINLGELYRSVSANDRALSSAEQAIELAAAQGAPRRYRDANALAGDAALELGDVEKSRGHWTEALAQDQADGAEATIPLSEIGLANVEAIAGENVQARERYRRAMVQLESSGQYAIDWLPLLGLAHSFEQDVPDSAAYYYDRALDALEANRVSDAAVGTGFVRGDRGKAYEGVLAYYVGKSNEDAGEVWTSRAFSVAERLKARGLLDLVQSALPAGEVPGMEALLDSLYTAPPGPEGRGARFRIEEQMASLRERHTRETLGASVPAASPLSLEAVAAGLPRGVLLLEYALGDSASYMWVVDRESVEMVELPPRAELEVGIEKLRAAIAARGGADAVLRSQARSLYDRLLQPANARVHAADAVVIVPDGVLFDLPFEVLLSADSEASAPWGSLPFLGRDVPLVYAPSATVWLGLRERADGEKPELELLAAGDPLYDEARGLSALPYSRNEVEAIGESVGKKRSRLLVGAEATESALKRELRERAPRVLHLAAHGLIDAAEPSRSSIALGTETDSGEDGYLYSLEIFSLPLSQSLVVLSACESARGRLQKGEGVVGLTRAFLGAGARGVVASLWPVSDESTAALMENLYKEMFEKDRPAAESLRRARAKLLDSEEYAHPFYWAAFVTVGSERAPW